MIFASDLDRTLLFSNKNFYESIPNEEKVMIDIKPDGTEVSFIPVKALNDLIKFSKILTFIPVTAREKHQLENVKFKENGVIFKYAIVGNGSSILEDGEINEEWDNIVKSIKRDINIDSLKKLIETNFIGVKYRERTFGFEIFAKNITNQLKNIIENFEGLRVEEDHRRSYIMYNGIDKLSALNFLKNKLKGEFIICSGDSVMDLPMIINSDLGIISSAGDLFNKKNYLESKLNNIFFTKCTDANVCTEIMKILQSNYSNFKVS